MNANLILRASLAITTWTLACSDASTNMGNPYYLSCETPPPAPAPDASASDSGGREDDAGGTPDTGGGVADGGDAGCPTFSNDIYLLMTGAWKCTSGGCHGGAYPPNIDPSSEGRAYAALSGYSPPNCQTLPFIHAGSTDPSATSFMAVLQGTTCGYQMPYSPGVLGTNDIPLVESWIACGMPEN